jgi:hypothetical protein
MRWSSERELVLCKSRRVTSANDSWSIFMTERCGSISAQWPPSIHDDVITTPYPKPIHEYELVSLFASSDEFSADRTGTSDG